VFVVFSHVLRKTQWEHPVTGRKKIVSSGKHIQAFAVFAFPFGQLILLSYFDVVIS